MSRLFRSLSPLAKGSWYYLGFYGVYGMFLPFINLYFREELGFSGRQIGIFAMFAPITALTVAIPVAALADRRHLRIPILMGSLACGSVMIFGMNFPHSFAALVPIWLIYTLFTSVASPIADSLIARMSQRHQLNFGSMRLWGSASFATSAIVGGLLWQRFGFRAMFIAAAVGFVCTVFFAGKLEDVSKEEDRQVKVPARMALRDKGLMVLIVTSFFLGIATNSSIVYDGIYMDTLGGGGSFVGLMFFLAAFSELPMMYLRGHIVKRLGTPYTLLCAFGFFLIAFGFYATARHPGMLLIAAVFKGLGFGLFFSSAVQFITERVPHQIASTAQSVFTATMYGLAPLLAAPLAGELYDRFGVTTIFLMASVAVFVAAAILFSAIMSGMFKQRLPRYSAEPRRGREVPSSV